MVELVARHLPLNHKLERMEQGMCLAAASFHVTQAQG